MSIFNDKYQTIGILCSGTFSLIFKAKEKSTNKMYALKMLENESKEAEIIYENELKIMKNIKSKYIIELKDYFYDENNECYCILMELCDGDLRQILNEYKPKGLPLNIINKIFIQLNEALKAMRTNGYTHRDLKPYNITPKLHKSHLLL